MKDRIRLVFGQHFDVPMANSAPVCVLAAILALAASVLLWCDGGSTMLHSGAALREVEVTPVQTTVIGADGYSPRLEVTADDGQVYVLEKQSVGRMFNQLTESLSAGEALTLTLGEEGDIMGVRQADLVHLDSGSALMRLRAGAVISMLLALVLDLAGAALLIRGVVLKMNRSSTMGYSGSNPWLRMIRKDRRGS